MSDRFPYPGDNSIIIQDGSIIWNDQSHDQSSLQYMDANDTIINDSSINESYSTAVDSNETQYFSILEHSNDITLEDLHNLTIGNVDTQENIVLTEDVSPAINEETVQVNKDEDDGTQVVVFTVDGCDDLFGIQLTQDEEGNIQKYQFKFRTTADGQLEAIPETIELLSNDDQATTETETETESLQVENEQTEELQETLEETQPQKYFLVHTQVNSEDQQLQQEEETQNEVEIHHEHTLVKGERQSPVAFEPAMETENFDPEEPQQNSEELINEEHTELIENVNIKTELFERRVEEENDDHNISHSVNIKVEHYPEVDECQDEQEEYNDTIQPQDDFEDIETNVIIKEQPQETMSEDDTELDQNEITIGQLENLEENGDEVGQEEEIDNVQSPLNQEELVQQFIQDNCQIEVEYEAESEDQERSPEAYEFKEVYNVQENEKVYAKNYMGAPNLNDDHDSDCEQYEIVEGLHVTGELNDELQGQVVTSTGTEPVLHEVIERYQEQNVERTNILKHHLVSTNKEQKTKKPFVSVKYYVVYPEKENVNSLADNTATQLPVPKLTKPNPRSVLRTSFIKPKKLVKHDKAAINSQPECDLFHKRFAKNKEAMRAKLFHNFLNRTTIPHAPIRQQRQPRKQEIKPVTERGDEEIIVQEVMVSSNGFVENLNGKMKSRLQVTAVVELSDSEDEPLLKTNKHRRKTHHIPRKNSESELSVIEIHSEEENESSNIRGTVKRGKGRPKKTDIEGKTLTLKRRRGRPPKINKFNLVDEKTADLKLSLSKRRTHNKERDKETTARSKSEINIDKEEIACPKCPKTFPSKNSLNTHIQHHNLENRLKNKATMSSKPSVMPRQSLLPKMEYNHKCLICEQTFKNSILLQRHDCTQKQAFLNCSVCLKQFRDVALFNIHKKSHIKSNLASNTNTARVSPRKSLYRPSCSSVNSPRTRSSKSVPANVFNCKQCLKVCDSEQSLAAHKKLHNKFMCSTCAAPFSSRLLLDTHVRTNCVKIKTPTSKRLSFKIKKSFVNTPPKRLSVCKPSATSRPTMLNQSVASNTTLNQSVASLNLDCEFCDMKFSRFRTLYTHKVQKHGLDTPDKSLLNKPRQGIFKPKPAHGGIPANDKMKRAFAVLRQKLAEMQDQSNVAQ